MRVNTETASVYNGPLSWIFPEGVDMVGGSAINDLYNNTVVSICNNIARVTKVYNNNSTFDKVTLLDNSVVTSSERSSLDKGTYSDMGAVKIPDSVTKSDIVKIELGNIYSFHKFTIVLKDLILQEVQIKVMYLVIIMVHSQQTLEKQKVLRLLLDTQEL